MNLSICVDASVVVQLITGGTHRARVVELLTTWHEAGHSIVAPALLYYEVSNALYRYAIHGHLTQAEATEALEAALALDISIVNDYQLHRQSLEVASTHTLPATYDAHYLVLAERLNAEFWTVDGRLARTVQDTLDWVHLIQ